MADLFDFIELSRRERLVSGIRFRRIESRINRKNRKANRQWKRAMSRVNRFNLKNADILEAARTEARLEVQRYLDQPERYARDQELETGQERPYITAEEIFATGPEWNRS